MSHIGRTDGWREGRGMVYLTTHSTHFYLRIYGIGHMVKEGNVVKDHSDSERGNQSVTFEERKERRKCFI